MQGYLLEVNTLDNEKNITFFYSSNERYLDENHKVLEQSIRKIGKKYEIC